MIDRLAIYLLLAGCVLFGAVIIGELRPGADQPPAIEVPSRPAAKPSEHREPRGRIDELLAETLSRPLFSSTRHPPSAGADDTPSDSDLADTRLAGILTEPGHRIAIFVPAGAKPLTVTEGETVSGWRVESITPREVSLTGPTGSKTLQPKIDPNLVPPPVQTPPTPAVPLGPAGAAARARNPPAAAVLPQPGVSPRLPVAPSRPGVLRGRR